MTRKLLAAALCALALAAAASFSLAEPRPAHADATTATLLATIGSTAPLNDDEFARVGNYLLFAVRLQAGDPGQLWRTDGTEAGTQLVTTIPSGVPFDLVSAGSWAAFVTPDGMVWRTDGTAAGTVQLTQPGELSLVDNLAAANGIIYFSAHDSTDGFQPWRTDGTAAGTEELAVIDPGGNGFASQFVQLGDAVYFEGNSANGEELWRSDGVPGGSTEEVADLNPSGDSNPLGLTVWEGGVYFSADDGTNGRQLWRADDSGASIVSTEVTDPGASAGNWFAGFVPMNGKLYFAGTDPTHGTELWRTDGTASGTELIVNINPTGDSTPGDYSGIVAAGGSLYFQATDGVNGLALWRSDGVPGHEAELVSDPYPSDTSNDNYPYVIASLTGAGSEALFTYQLPDNSGVTLDHTDGTTTAPVVTITGTDPNDPPWICGNSGSASCDFPELNGAHIFTAHTSTGLEIWRYGDLAPTSSSSGSGSTTTPPAGEATVAASAAGTLTAADGSTALTWPAGTFPTDVTLVVKPVPVASAAGLVVGASPVVVSVTATDSGGQPVTTLAKPLVIHFSSGLGGMVPASSSDGGTSWTPIPLLGTPALPDGQRDGYFVGSDGSVDIFTRHLTLFGLFADTQAPRSTTPTGRFARGSLHLSWSPATDNGRIATYEIDLDGKRLLSVGADATSASTRAFNPHGRTSYTLIAIDAAGNRSTPDGAVVIERSLRPKAVPKSVPAWAFALERWGETPSATRGPRPAAAPRRLPSWYRAWIGWRDQPFRIVP